MFKFLKDKLKSAVSIFSKKVDEEVEEQIEKAVEEEQPREEKVEEVEKKEDKSKPKKEKPKKKPVEETKEEKAEEKEKTPIDTLKEEDIEKKEEPKEKKSFFKKIKDTITTTTLSETKFNELFWDLEIALLENNVAIEVIEKIKNDLKEELVESKVARKKINETIIETLTNSMNELLSDEKIDLIKRAKKKKPFVILFVGVNGSGKTTTLAKLAYLLQEKNLGCVLAAGDTFRAAAIEQLTIHADNLGAKIIKQEHGSDSAAVAFDAIKHAEANNKDFVLIDTAGRSHSNTNLMDELRKVNRVANPDLVLFIGDSLTGNDVVEQAKSFNDAIGLDGIILTKTDVDEKGGAAISISYVTGKPILFIGVGQEYTDLKEFDKSFVLNSLGF